MELHCKIPAYGRDRTETSMNMDGAARKRSFLWAVPRVNAHCYNRYYTQTLIITASSARKRLLLWPVPHTNAHYYGQHRAQTFIFMDGTDTPFGPYKIIQRGGKMVFSRFANFCFAILLQSHNIVSQACTQKAIHYTFCMYILPAYFANILQIL